MGRGEAVVACVQHYGEIETNKEISVSMEWSKEGEMVTGHKFQDISVNAGEWRN